MQRPPRVEVLLYHREQVLAGAVGASGIVGGGGDPRVGEGGMGGHAGGGIDRQAPLDEVTGVKGDAAPVLERCEGVVGN